MKRKRTCESRVSNVKRARKSKTYSVYEGDSVHDFFTNHPKIRAGDFIEYVANNQQGYQKYKVVINKNKKELELQMLE